MKKFVTYVAVSAGGLVLLTWSLILPVVGLMYLLGRLT